MTELGTSTHIELVGVSKAYEGTFAVRDLNLKIERGTVHALVGENGAGKSTVSKMIVGSVTPTSGSIEVAGQPVSLNPRKAMSLGLTMIEQELSMVPASSVIDNVFLGMELGRGGFLDRGAQRKRFLELVERTGFALNPNSIVGSLRVADQQKVEILRALARNAELIIMDEPTAPLTMVESEQLYEIINWLRESGTTIVYISHFLDEVLALSDTVTVMRDGQHVSTTAAVDESEETVVQKMLGRSMSETEGSRHRKSENAVILEARNLNGRGRFHDVSLEVRPGEILGIAGLIGSGRSEVLRALAGVDNVDGGQIIYEGRPVRWKSPKDAIDNGVVLLPESRKELGLILGARVSLNMMLSRMTHIASFGFIRPSLQNQAVQSLTKDLDIRAKNSTVPVSTLSGGNQQKVMFARCLNAGPKVLLVDEPTRGVDIGAKEAIRDIIQSCVDEGMAVILVSSELEEVLELADRVVVMRLGTNVAEFSAEEASQEAILAAAFGMEIAS